MRNPSLPQLIYHYRRRGYDDPQIKKHGEQFKMVISCPAVIGRSLQDQQRKNVSTMHYNGLNKITAW